MIYYMEPNSSSPFSPMIDYGRVRYGGPLADIEAAEKSAPDHLEYRDLPYMPSFSRCEPIPDDVTWRIPKTIYHVSAKPREFMPDISNMAVTERFHDFLEEFDPGGHQFFPVEIVHKKSGKKYSDQGQFYLWNVLSKVCPQDLFDYPRMQAADLLVVRTHDGTPYKSYHIKTSVQYFMAKSGKHEPDYSKFATRRAAFGKKHIVYCQPCGNEVQAGDVHQTAFWPLVTPEFRSATKNFNVSKTHTFYPIPTVDD